MDSRWLIEYWNFYDWLGVASAVILVAMVLGVVACGVDAVQRFVSR